jgi:hypothetical protein
MSNRQLAQAFQQFSREAQRLYKNLNRQLIDWLLRSTLVSTRRGQNPAAGFILPTTILLLLVVTLTVGAITLRAVDRNTQVIANTQQKVIYNAATPAIDRARAKIEFLFDPQRDTRYPGGVPTESAYILPGMLNRDKGSLQRLTPPDGDTKNPDVYTLPDEKRLDIGGTDIYDIKAGDDDNAWSYPTDTNGDGIYDATVVYSILFQTPSDSEEGGKKVFGTERLIALSDAEKAKALLVRNAPISNDAKLSGCNSADTGTAGSIKDGWYPDKSSSSKIRKNFQVDAIVIPYDPKAAAITMEFQQDRQLDKGNKWGAWFRYDLEIHPGDPFNWNGAMHSEGNLIVGSKNTVTAYLISAKKSCLFQPDSSEVSVTKLQGKDDPKDEADLGPKAVKAPNNNNKEFYGQVLAAKIGKEEAFGSAVFHYHDRDNPQTVKTDGIVSNDKDQQSIKSGTKYIGVLSDPVSIMLGEQYQSRMDKDEANVGLNDWDRFKNLPVGGRIINRREKLPYVDDLYRADDRWGPKPKYDDKEGGRIQPPSTSGSPIDKVKSGRLLTAGLPGESSSGVGLDGYWERRARIDGLRILVSERLELGDIGGWETPRDIDGDSYIKPPKKDGIPVLVDGKIDGIGTAIKAEEKAGDSLYPPTVKPYPVEDSTKRLDHRMQSRRSLRDNLPAVQSAAIYHAGIEAPHGANNDVDYPVACLSMTSHPGNVHTLRNSINFIPTFFAGTGDKNRLDANFFTGQGTNGWEFDPPAGDYDKFVAAVSDRNSPLRIALENLANFAGDPDGAFPPKQETTENVIHPYPALTMWGNYSNLRRALVNLDGAGGYASLSVADKTYLQTASCTLGMLAYNVDRVQAFDVTSDLNDGRFGDGSNYLLFDLAQDLVSLMDGKAANGEVIPKFKMATYGYANADDNADGPPNKNNYNPADYYEVPPEAYIAALKQKYAVLGKDPLTESRVRLAELIMLKHQIRRDRTFGFRSSPAFGEYAVEKMDASVSVPYGVGRANMLVFPTACDPDLFVLKNPGVAENLERQPFTDKTSGTLLSIPPAANATVVSPGAVTEVGVSSLSQYRVALSRLCGAIDATNYRGSDGNALANVGKATTFGPENKATVKPMFPSLYYLFPEEAHTLQGDLTNAGVKSTKEVADKLEDYDHRQPGAMTEQVAVKAGLYPKDKEPYVIDTYVAKIAQTKNVLFRPVAAASAAAPMNLGTTLYANTFQNPVPINSAPITPATADSIMARRPYKGSIYPAVDLPVSGLVLNPRPIVDWVTPTATPQTATDNISPNRILVPNGAIAPNMLRNNGVEKAVAFLDRAIYDGRQDLMVRLTDIDLGMLRQTKPKNLLGFTSYQNKTDKAGANELWLPMSGIVYGFREDSVREDAIARKAQNIDATIEELVKGTSMNQTDLANPYDSQVIATSSNISLKPIDFLPDPDRRIHGFRLRNGERIDRPTVDIGSLKPGDTYRGLSFFTDQPVYIQGDLNLHKNDSGTFLEEFQDTIQVTGDYGKFYDRARPDPEFAKPEKDHWRPSEILADSIDILSENFCDGSIADGFMPNTPPADVTAVKVTDFIPGFPDYNPSNDAFTDIARDRYKSPTSKPNGLYGGEGCSGNGKTSFQNQAIPNKPGTQTPTGQEWDWMRENNAMPISSNPKKSWQDFTTPVKISRTGDTYIVKRPDTTSATTQLDTLPNKQKLVDYRPVRYELDAGLTYVSRNEPGKYSLIPAKDTRVNSIVVGGIQPSRLKQGYGGLQNFPRFLENWKDGGKKLTYNGSFIQLNFSNYATSGYEKEGSEPIEVNDSGGKVPPGAVADERIPYYGVPIRIWGYDVALQFMPAGPAAARFVTPSSTRSEFYTEPPRTDPYIRQLCIAGKPIVQKVAPKNQFNCP